MTSRIWNAYTEASLKYQNFNILLDNTCKYSVSGNQINSQDLVFPHCYDSRWLAIHCKHEAPFPPFCLERDTLQQKVVIKLMQECKWALDELSNWGLIKRKLIILSNNVW